MDGIQITNILSKDKATAPYFRGVFAADTIPILQAKSCVVVNQDISSGPGSHWLAMYVNEFNDLEFFDSYGQTPTFHGKVIEEYVSKYHNTCWNSITFQSMSSNVCGPYCIYFIVKRCQGNSMYSIISKLSVSKKNDFRMYQYVKKKYGVRMIYVQ